MQVIDGPIAEHEHEFYLQPGGTAQYANMDDAQPEHASICLLTFHTKGPKQFLQAASTHWMSATPICTSTCHKFIVAYLANAPRNLSISSLDPATALSTSDEKTGTRVNAEHKLAAAADLGARPDMQKMTMPVHMRKTM